MNSRKAGKKTDQAPKSKKDPVSGLCNHKEKAPAEGVRSGGCLMCGGCQITGRCMLD